MGRRPMRAERARRTIGLDIFPGRETEKLLRALEKFTARARTSSLT